MNLDIEIKKGDEVLIYTEIEAIITKIKEIKMNTSKGIIIIKKYYFQEKFSGLLGYLEGENYLQLINK